MSYFKKDYSNYQFGEITRRNKLLEEESKANNLLKDDEPTTDIFDEYGFCTFCGWNSSFSESHILYCSINDKKCKYLVELGYMKDDNKKKKKGKENNIINNNDVGHDKIYINCSYDRREEAKKYNCKFDGEKKLWYYYDNNKNKEIISQLFKMDDVPKTKIKKTLYSSNTVCKFCAKHKLDHDEINNILKYHYFSNACDECIRCFNISQYI